MTNAISVKRVHTVLALNANVPEATRELVRSAAIEALPRLQPGAVRLAENAKQQQCPMQSSTIRVDGKGPRGLHEKLLADLPPKLHRDRETLHAAVEETLFYVCGGGGFAGGETYRWEMAVFYET